MNAADVFKELEAGKFRSVYLIAGEEPFQTNEILARFKSFFTKQNSGDDFLVESWDGEGLSFEDFRNSLEEMPGLFTTGPTTRYLVCQRYEKVAPSYQEKLETYQSRNK